MATVRNGPLGHYQGKIGNLVFYILNGKQVVRTRGKTMNEPTLPQLKCRQGLVVISNFLKNITSFINVGFNEQTKGTNRYPVNAAFSYNRKNALTGVYPDIELDYSKAMVSQGKIAPATNPSAEIVTSGVKFDWLCPADLDWPRTEDRVMLMVYFPVLQKAEYIIYGPKRSKLSAVFNLSAELLTSYMEVYISFVAEDGRKAADSIYLGSFNG